MGRSGKFARRRRMSRIVTDEELIKRFIDDELAVRRVARDRLRRNLPQSHVRMTDRLYDWQEDPFYG